MKKKNTKKYNNDWPIVAICYDFDKTLSPKDMQEFGLIPKLNCSAKEFWDESNEMARKEGMDKILAYMWTIIEKAGRHISITEKDFNNLGKGIKLFPGVDTWFDRINEIAEEIHVNVEHYIISAGLREIIKGTSIGKYFKEIYASAFLYEVTGKPFWPRQVVNYTTKTQYLFRISKDCLDLSDEDSVNEYQEEAGRRIPFSNFIYIGDSETDIPAMKIVKNGGGISIGVYNPQTRKMDRVRKLLKQERINFLMPADYTKGSRMEKLVTDTLRKICTSNVLTILNSHQKDYVNDLEFAEELIPYTDSFLDRESLDEADIKNVSLQARHFAKKIRKDLHSRHDDISASDEIDAFMDEIDEKLKNVLNQKKRAVKQQRELMVIETKAEEKQDESDNQSED